MKRLKGPKLSKPDVRVPAIVEDVYWDLRERRLLPLVALVVVAIAATPLLLGGDSVEPVTGPTAGGGGAPEGMTEDASSLKVVQAKPGLRDYRKRLSDRKSKNPFRQRFNAPVLDEAELNPETGGPSGTVEVEGQEPGGAPGGSPTRGGSPDDSGKTPDLRLYSFAIKVRITKHGGKNAATKIRQRTVRERVLPNTPLPGKRAAVVTYVGVNESGKKAMLIVSTKVEAVFGDIRCVTEEDICQLIEVEPGFPVTFVYGANEVRYTINVVKIEPVATGRL